MELDTLNDLRLTSVAVNSWLTNDPKKRAEAIEAMFAMATTHPDEQLRLKAFELLLKADLVDLKREEVELKKQAADDDRRIRLLEVIGRIPAGEVAKLAALDAESVEG